MGWDGNGTYTRDNGDHTGSNVWTQDKNGNFKITAARHDAHDEDLADGIRNCLTKNGENAATADLDFGGFKAVNYGSTGGTLLESSTAAFTPVVSTSNADGTFTMNEEVGQYTLIGNLVIYSVDINASISGSPTGDLRVSLPFASDGTTSGSGNIGFYQGISSDKGVYVYIAAGDQHLTLQRASTTATTTVNASTDVTSPFLLRATIIYVKVP